MTYHQDSPGTHNDVFLHTDITDPRAAGLFAELSYEYTSRYGEGHGLDFKTSPEMKRYPPILFRPPLGGFVLLMRDGEAIAGGGFMPIDERTAEIKRVWTAAGFRRQGLSSRVMAHMEAEIARRGFTRVYLTTGPRQPEAKNLYLKSGYTPLFDVEVDPETIGPLPFEKIVTPVETHSSERWGFLGWITRWRQHRAVARAWTLRHPIERRLDDAVTGHSGHAHTEQESHRHANETLTVATKPS